MLMYTIIYAICTALNLAFSMVDVVRLHRLRRMNMLSYVTRNADVRLFGTSERLSKGTFHKLWNHDKECAYISVTKFDRA